MTRIGDKAFSANHCGETDLMIRISVVWISAIRVFGDKDLVAGILVIRILVTRICR